MFTPPGASRDDRPRALGSLAGFPPVDADGGFGVVAYVAPAPSESARTGAEPLVEPMQGDAGEAFGVVPAGLLERPPREEVRDIDSGPCAMEVDRQLRRLARHEALCRRTLGTLAGALLHRRGHHDLGFARLGDYTRERLGLSPREVQGIARVVRALGELPETAVAFDRGEISWTQARLLAEAATRVSEGRWLAVARGRTTRALELVIRQARSEATGAPDRGDAATFPASDARSPRGARSPDGDDYGENDEGLIDGEPAVRFRVRCPRRVRILWRRVLELARRMAGEQLSLWQAIEAVAAEGLAGVPAHPASERASECRPGPSTGAADRARVPGTGSAEAEPAEAAAEPAEAAWTAGLAFAPVRRGDEPAGDRAPDDPRETRAAFGELDWTPLAEALPGDVAALMLGLDGLDSHALDARLRTVVGAQQRTDWQTGRLLRLFFDLRLYQAMGFASASRYVRERLGLSYRKAQALVAVERHTWRAPAFAEAYHRGAISWVRALTLLPILHDAHAAAWVARANAVTVRRLAAEVEWALEKQDTSRPYAPAAPPPPGSRLERPEAQLRAPTGWETIDAEVAATGPASVMALLRAAIAAFVAAPEPLWRGLERLLEHVEREWTAQPAHRDPIFARDGWRCAVPACGSRKNLHDHHLRFRSRGGTNVRANRVTVCAWHHLRAIHSGTVQAWGRAPDGVWWELGVRPRGRPLLRLLGERYLPFAAEG